MIYVVGTAFVVVVMAKERVALVHKTAAMTDLLTGLFNRRAFLEAANATDRAARAASRSRSACWCSISTSSNRSTTASAMPSATTRSRCSPRPRSANVRATDVIGRLGGEEFAAIIPGNAAEAGLVAERAARRVPGSGVVISGHEIGATVSIGIATAIPPVTIDPLLARADAALYRAKRNGRNRVVAAEPEEAPAIAPEKAGSLVPELRPVLVAAH